MSSSSRRSVRPLFFGLLCLAAPVAAQGHKLSGPLARPLGGDIFSYALSPDGSRVVYTADQERDGVLELFSARANAAGTSVKLAGPAFAEGDVSRFWIGPQSRRVVFAGDLDVEGVGELYSVAVDGGAITKLSGPMVRRLGGVVFRDYVQIDPAETRVVYMADEGFGFELHSVPIDGGPVVKLNPPLSRLEHVASFQISPDGTRVVYLAGQGAHGVDQLFVVPIAGGPAVKLNPPQALDVQPGFVLDARSRHAVFVADIAPGKRQVFSASLRADGPVMELLPAPVQSVPSLLLSADGTRAVCTTVSLTGSSLQLVSVQIGRPPPGTPRSAASSFTGVVGQQTYTFSAVTLYSLSTPSQRFDDIELTPDSRSVLFEAGTNAKPFQLFRAPLDGSAPAVALDDSWAGAGLEISPDGARVVYGAIDGLFSALIDGSAPPVRLADPSMTPTITRDGSRVLYLSTELELFSVPIGGGTPLKLNAPLPFGGHVGTLAASFQPPVTSPLDGRVLYLADQEADEVFELFTVPEDGSASPLRVSGSMRPGPVEGDVYGLELSSDGAHAVYLADAHLDNQFELFSVRSDGRGEPVALHGPMAPGEHVSYFEIAPDGASVVYLLAQPERRVNQLRVVPIGGGPSLLLSEPDVPNVYGGYGSFEVDPTSTRVVFSTFDLPWGPVRLESVPLDGSAPPVLLHGPQPRSGSFLFTPDGVRGVYTTDLDGDNRDELLSVRVDGTGSPTRLDAADLPLCGVGGFLLTPGGDRVLYTADQAAHNQFELFVVPVDGSAAPLRLIPAPMRSLGGLATAGDYAFYVSNQAVVDRMELYRLPLDGSAPPVKLNAPLVSGGNVRRFVVTPDGTRVVYWADQQVDERFELYSAPADGSGPAKKLNGPLGKGDVGGEENLVEVADSEVFALSQDGTRVVFFANPYPNVSENRRLFSAPVDGSGPAVRISAPLLHYGDHVLGGYRFTPDGRSVVYRVLIRDIGHIGLALFQASLESPGDVRRLSGYGTLPYHYAEPDFAFTPDGQRILFQLDQETNGVTELFLSLLTPMRKVSLRR